MTLGPDLEWLADPEGNLRPGAAEALAQPTPAAPQRPASPRPWRGAVAGAAARPAALGAVSGLPRLGIPPAWVPAVVFAAALAGVLAGRWTAREAAAPLSRESFAPQSGPPVSSPGTIDPEAADTPVRPAVITGTNVNLRTGPGLFAPVLWKLGPGEAVSVGGEHRGWFTVETATGLRGYVFGALLSGPASNEGRPATVVEPMRAQVNGDAIELRPGDRVLARLSDGRTATILLPSGLRLGVPRDAVALLD